MTDDIWRREEIESPCIKVCLIHPDARICVGCFRTPEEIARWGRMPAPERQKLMAELPDRADMVKRRRGGRSRRTP